MRKKPSTAAIKDNDLHMLIGFERHDDLVELAGIVSGPKILSGG